MAPKIQQSLSELGRPTQHGNGWRALAKLGPNWLVSGPQRSSKVEAQEDLDAARKSESREAFAQCLDGFKAKGTGSDPRIRKRPSTAETSSRPRKKKKTTDSRRFNSGQPGNSGNKTERRGGRGCAPTGSSGGGRKLPLGRYVFKQYKISGLDLAMARRAQELHQWPDQCCVDALMRRLEAGSGGMQFSTHFHRQLYMGRLWSDWPTPLHVNRGFRAALFWPQKDQYTDLDMTSSHNHIAVYLGRGVGQATHGILAYLQARATWHEYLLQLGIAKREVKQLWVSLLNGGTLRGWQRNLQKQFGIPRVKIPAALHEHLLLFKRDAVALRSRLLLEERWKRIHEKVCSEAASSRLKQEAQLRRSWNLVLGTMESQLMRELESIVRSFGATVVMPSYDGMLLHHQSPIDLKSAVAAWHKHCEDKYQYVFPVEDKSFEQDLPQWLLLVS